MHGAELLVPFCLHRSHNALRALKLPDDAGLGRAQRVFHRSKPIFTGEADHIGCRRGEGVGCERHWSGVQHQWERTEQPQ
eukprot:267279-Pleurochrysis_carterae.AAC.1